VPRALAAIGAAAVAFFGAGAATAAAAESSYVVVYRDATTDAAATTRAIEHSAGVAAQFRYGSALKGFSARLSSTELARVRARPEVAFVTPDETFTAASLQPVSAGETVPPGIRRVQAASLTEAHQAATSAVAVLDTGVDLANADLDAVSGKNCISSTAAAKDDNGHGTNVAGIVAARDNGSLVTGVAPGTRIVSVKVLNAKASGTLSQILCGIDWVSANAAAWNIRVANMSITGAGRNDGNCGYTNKDVEHQAICRSAAAGVTYVAAAGNSKVDFAASIPASYPEVLTATAMSDTDGTPGALGRAPSCKSGEADDKYGSYSNYAVGSAASAHTLAAPGTCIVSDRAGGGTSTYYGTSQAAPHVAGTVALCIGGGGVDGPCAGLSPAAVIARVRSDAAAAATLTNGFAGDPLRPVSGRYYGYLATAAGY
jgi:subtilisin family serine protease